MKTLFFVITLISLNGLAQHKEHGAHVHGAAQLGIAVDGKKMDFEYDGSAMSIIGFEHKPKSAKDKKQAEVALSSMKNDIQSFFTFSGNLKCQVTKNEVEIEYDGNHSDLEAKYTFECDKELLGNSVSIDFSKKFPNLKSADLQIITDKSQSSVKIKKFPFIVELK